MLAVFGQVIHWPTVITLLLFPLIVLAYVRLAKREESALTERFGEEYQTYRQRVPSCPHACEIGGSLSIHCSLLISNSLVSSEPA